MGYGTIRNPVENPASPAAAKMAGVYDGNNVRNHLEIFDLADADFDGDADESNLVCKLPAGTMLKSIIVASSVSLTTSQLSFGDADDPDRFGAAAAYGTTAGVREEYLDVASIGTVIAEETALYMTATEANLPASGTIAVQVETVSRG